MSSIDEWSTVFEEWTITPGDELQNKRQRSSRHPVNQMKYPITPIAASIKVTEQIGFEKGQSLRNWSAGTLVSPMSGKWHRKST